MDRNEIRLQLIMANPGKSIQELDELACWVEDAPIFPKQLAPKWKLTNEMVNVGKILGRLNEITYSVYSADLEGDLEYLGGETTSHDLYVILQGIDAYYSSRR